MFELNQVLLYRIDAYTTGTVSAPAAGTSPELGDEETEELDDDTALVKHLASLTYDAAEEKKRP